MYIFDKYYEVITIYISILDLTIFRKIFKDKTQLYYYL